MRFLLSVLAALLAVAPMASAVSGPLFSASALSLRELENMFTQWMTQYEKVYSYEEFSSRFVQFKANVERIRQHNVDGDNSYTLGLNEFADLSQEEFRTQYLTGLKQKNCASNSRLDSLRVRATPPPSIDWRTKGAVSPVQNEGQVGQSWPFSAAGAVEGAWVSQGHHTLETVSPQFLFDCCPNQGGSVDVAFQYVVSHGACSNYTTGQCSSCTHDIKMSAYQDIKSGDENGLLNAVGNIGPVAVGIEADGFGFQFYTGGVYSASCGLNINHDVLVVGYGTDSGSDYWTVKNSWGTSWGEAGYIRLIRGQNECGVAVAASYPTV